MSKLLQLRGGTTSQHNSFTGAVREVTVDTDKDTLVVHDGSTQGGFALPRTAAQVVALISDNSIDSQHYAADSIDAEHLAPNSVNTDAIIDDAVTSAHLAAGSVDATALATNSVDSAELIDGSVDTSHLSADCVTTAKIADNVALGGSPTTTTQAESDDSTKIATTAYVVDKITTLIGGAPSTLNDLNELAAAINDDASYNSTLTTALGTKLAKSGGTMTGDLILPDNVKLEIGSLSGGDLQIYHDSSAGASYIKDVGTGSLQIAGSSQVNILNGADSEYCAKFITDGAVELYHNNVKKIETTAAGATVTGVLTATLQANAIDSDHYTNGSIDTAHIGAEQITEPLMAANSIDSHAYVDGSIDEVHLSDNSVDSRAYVDGSIDLAHISSEAVDEDNLYISNAGSNGQFLSKQTGNNGGLTWATVSSEDFIPNGSVMVFFQAAAPTGWTKVTTQNDKTLRVVSGNGGGTGGDWAMSAGETTSSHGGHVHTGAAHTHTSAAHTHNGASHSHGGGNLAAAAHTISTSQMPSHNHNIPFANNNNGNQYAPENRSNGSGIGTSSTGGGASHSHGMSGNTAAATPGTSGSTTPGATGSTTPGNSGSAGSHTHTIAAPQYIDVIICSKDA